jgi:hypothetical protein
MENEKEEIVTRDDLNLIFLPSTCGDDEDDDDAYVCLEGEAVTNRAGERRQRLCC